MLGESADSIVLELDKSGSTSRLDKSSRPGSAAGSCLQTERVSKEELSNAIVPGWIVDSRREDFKVDSF